MQRFILVIIRQNKIYDFIAYVAGAGTQKFKHISNAISLTNREYKNSVSSEESSSKKGHRGKRISLIDRQNMIAQKAQEIKSNGNSSNPSNTNSQTNLRPNQLPI